MLDTDEPIGQRVRRLRLERALSQADLAKRAGVSRQAVMRIESGGRVWPSTLRGIARGLGVRPAHLTRGSDWLAAR